jgi:tetratricopeptide (TPR) repeat protein
LYALGRAEWKRRTLKGLEGAAGYFRRAIDRDSTFARAWAGLADVYAIYEIYGGRGVPRDTAYTWAKAAALRAIALDSTLAEPHASLNQILRYGYSDWAGSERAILRALALDPTYATAHQWHAEHLMYFGRLPEANVAARKAAQFDPLAPATNNVLALTLQYGGRMDEAIAVLRPVVSRDVTVGLGPETLFWTYVLAGRVNEALALRHEMGDTTSFWRDIARARTDPRARTAALKVLARGGIRDSVGPAWTSRLYAYLGVREPALAELERALAERDPAIEFIKVDPLWDSVRSDPRFAAVVAGMGLPL